MFGVLQPSCLNNMKDSAVKNNEATDTVGPRFTMVLRSRIFGCKSNRRKTSAI